MPREGWTISQRPWDASDVKNMDITGRFAENDWHVKNAAKRTLTTGKKFPNEKKYPNCEQDHPANSRSCDIYKKEKEILEVKHKGNVTFLQARKILEPYMGENTKTSVALRADSINQNNKYRILAEKQILLEPNDGLKFLDHLKNYTWPNFSKQKLNN